jgi:allophanate hydrolase
VPFALKDNIDIAGQPTTAACPAFTHDRRRNATVVQRLLDAGALWLGKTNLDQFATGLVGTRSPYGRPPAWPTHAHQRRLQLRLGGGGGARAWCPSRWAPTPPARAACPAGFNGLVGLKPTPGRVSTAGVLPACRSLDCVSIFAHSVDDAATVLAVLEGADADDAYSAFAPGPATLPATRASACRRRWTWTPRRLRPAWPPRCSACATKGHTLVPIDFGPLHEVAALLYDGPWVAERHAVVQAAAGTQPEAFDPTVRRVIARALDFDATDAFQAPVPLRNCARSWPRCGSEVDQLLVPTAPTHPTFAEVDADPVGANARLGTYTNFVNLLGWCALAVPAGRTPGGLPFGVTASSPRRLRRRAGGFTRGGPGHRRRAPPLRRPATEPTLSIAVVGAHLSGLPLNGQLRERGATCCRPRPPRRTTGCSRCPAPRRPSPACSAWPTAARPSRSRSGPCRCSGGLVPGPDPAARWAWAAWNWPTAATCTASSANRCPGRRARRQPPSAAGVPTSPSPELNRKA